MPTITYTEKLETTTCWCGISHAIPAALLRSAHNDAQPIYCPMGHRGVWEETEAQKERKKREQAERRATSALAALDQERASHSATKGQLTKTKKRLAGGACPCCKRTFVNLQRHMTGQHPNYAVPTETS